jgi:hypothetical protein
MVPLARYPACSGVARHAISSSWNVQTGLARCTAAVMATSALGGRCVQTVVGFGSTPTACSLVAGLTSPCDRGVNRCRRFTGYTVSRT